MNELEQFLVSEKADLLSKKERLVEQSKLTRYQRFLGGLKDLKAMPDIIILASATEDKIAIEEANQLHVPIIAITDTDMNPERITYPIPANDDAPKAVELILQAIIASPTKKTGKAEESSNETKSAEEVKVAKKPETKTKKTSAPKKTAAKASVKKATVKVKKVAKKK